MNIVDFIKDNLKEIDHQYNYKISEELNFNFQAEKDNIVVRLQQGNRYQRGVVIPISILVTSKNVLKMKAIWNEWVLKVSDETYIEGTDSYYMIYMTPAVTQVFDEISNNYYSVISILGTIVETNNSNDITKFEIKTNGNDWQSLSVNDFVIGYNSGVNSEQEAGTEINTSKIINTVVNFTLTTYIEVGDLFTKLRQMRLGTLTNNTTFQIRVTWVDGITEEYFVKNSSHTIRKAKGEITTINLIFTV